MLTNFNIYLTLRYKNYFIAASIVILNIHRKCSYRNMGELDITIGIPIANNEDTIKQTLNLLTNQSRKPDRIIIVYHSTDSTPRIIDRTDHSVDIRIDLYKRSNTTSGV